MTSFKMDVVKPDEEVFYRYDAIIYSGGLDEFDNPLGVGTTSLRLSRYRVVRRTPKGVWVDGGFFKEKFVLLSARKKFACPTKKEAAVSFAARKKRQIGLLENQLRTARQALELIAQEAAKDDG